jgi:hypothetical protein
VKALFLVVEMVLMAKSVTTKVPPELIYYSCQRNLLGSIIFPSIADAATVAGDARYTFDDRAPILPTKFLEDDDMHISFSPNAPR